MPISWVRIEKFRLKDQEGNKPPTPSELILLSRVQLILPISEMGHGAVGYRIDESLIFILARVVPTNPWPSNTPSPHHHALLYWVNRPHREAEEDNECPFWIALFSEGNMTNLLISWSLLRDSVVALTFHIFAFIIHDYNPPKVTKIPFFVFFSLIWTPEEQEH